MGKPRDKASHGKRGLLPLTAGTEDLLREHNARAKREFSTLTGAQDAYVASMRVNTLTFGLGPAGTGKTWCAGNVAAELLLARSIERIIVTRPIVESGERLGFLPGTEDEKIAPYFRPARDVLERALGRGHVEALIKAKKIEFLPLAFMRGTSIDNAFMWLDEAQNTTPLQMKMFLTRIGEGTRATIDGDLSQVDIDGPSGLHDALDRLEGLDECGVVRFLEEDIVRSGIVREILLRYRRRR